MRALYYACDADVLTRSTRYPVLLAIDDFQALYGLSAYRDTFFKMVKAYHLTLPRALLEFASGKRTFVRPILAPDRECTDTCL